VDDLSPLRISGVVLDAPDAAELAAFYCALLGWEVDHEDQGWVKLRSPHGGAGLAVQSDPEYVPPTWPGRAGEQRMMAHLDIQVEGLDSEVERAVALGARLADHQPQDDVRVMIDPVGHPFCLWDPAELTG
jgi:catechol 2,3-dioxygenase-like lactoylglutathione lyase family enzyme